MGRPRALAFSAMARVAWVLALMVTSGLAAAGVVSPGLGIALLVLAFFGLLTLTLITPVRPAIRHRTDRRDDEPIE